MISRLHINNYTLIDSLLVDFTTGLNIITGETGAGKSILLGALGLILGERADSGTLRNKEHKCVIEAEIEIGNYALEEFFGQNGLDYSPQTIIRREILPSGKSRAFVNDTPVLLDTLGKLSERLVDIHSQHQTLAISSQEFQFALVDAFAANASLLSSYRGVLSQYHGTARGLTDVLARQADIRKGEDFNRFQLEELVQAKLSDSEQQELEAELCELSHAQEIAGSLSQGMNLLEGENFGILPAMAQLKNGIGQAGTFSPKLSTLAARIESLYIEAKDISNEISSTADDIEFNPQRMDIVSERLDMIYRLQKKHGVQTIGELLGIEEKLAAEVALCENLDEEIASLQKRCAQELHALEDSAQALAQSRLDVSDQLCEAVLSIVRTLGMPNATMGITYSASADFHTNGKERINILFSANLGGRQGEVDKVASGGELSRIMLAVKNILSAHSHLPTIIFDEIDTGVSGETADRMGEVMRSMGVNMQVIAITHLPQIAAKGASHYKVFKTESQGTTCSQIRRLDQDGRVEELAKMLSGQNVTDAALAQAQIMLAH